MWSNRLGNMPFFLLKLAPIGALFSHMNRRYNTIYINKFLPPPGCEPGSLGTISGMLGNRSCLITYRAVVLFSPKRNSESWSILSDANYNSFQSTSIFTNSFIKRFLFAGQGQIYFLFCVRHVKYADQTKKIKLTIGWCLLKILLTYIDRVSYFLSIPKTMFQILPCKIQTFS